jgi:fluoride ion exporter CrcB/FEX
MTAKDYYLVFLGGAIGALLRYLIGGVLELTIGANNAGSLSLLIVNVLGAMFLGIVNFHPRFASETKKSFWAAGFCGGFTTMSGIAIFLYHYPPLLAMPAAAVMFGFGFIGYAAGANIGKASAGNK